MRILLLPLLLGTLSFAARAEDLPPVKSSVVADGRNPCNFGRCPN
jgi:hypothetical protein